MALLVLLLVAPSVLANQYLRQPYDNDNEFNAPVKFGANVTLRCGDKFVPNPSTIDYWILPSNEVMEKKEIISLGPHPIDGVASWQVSDNGSEIYIINLMEVHFGLYFCMTQNGSGRYAVKRGINYNGPYFGDLWQVYRTNTMVGGIAAAVFVVLATIVFGIYTIRFKDSSPSSQVDASPDVRKDNVYENADTLPVNYRAGPSGEYQNQGYNVDEVTPYATSNFTKPSVEDTTKL